MANPPLGSLVDAFTASAINTAVWNASSGSGVSLTAPGRVGVLATTAFTAFGAAGPYEATGQSLYARVAPAPAGTGGANVQTLLKIQLDANNGAYLVCAPGTQWQAVVLNAGVYTTVNLPAFDPTAHAWWRLTESSGQWLFSVSADGYAWTQVAAVSYSWSPHAAQVFFIAGTASVTGQTAYLEHVNTPSGASGLMPSWPLVQFQVAFNTGGPAPGMALWTDLTSRMRDSWTATQSGRQYELDAVQTGTAKVTLTNLDGAFDSTNASSPYTPNVIPFRLARFQATWPATRNLLPRAITSAGISQSVADGTAPASAWHPWIGSVAPISGLAAAPTGHTTATAWSVPSGTSSNPSLGYPLLTGGTGSGAEPTSCPVVAGQTYSFSLWVSRSTGGDTTLSTAAAIDWYRQDGSQISSVTGSTVAVTTGSSWVPASVSGTAPAGAVWARVLTWVVTSGTTSFANTYYLTALQFEQAAAPTPWTAPGATSPLWTGYVERWLQHWKTGPVYGTVDVTCVDALAGLSRMLLQPNLEASLLALSPDRLYPLDEPSGSTGFRDLTGKHGQGNVLHSPYGSGTVTFGNSVTGSGFNGASGPVTTIANPTPSALPNSAGSFLNLAAPNGPPTGAGWTRVICFRTTTVPASTAAMALWWWQAGASSNQSQGGLYIDSNQHVNASTNNSAGQAINSSVPTVTVCDGNWHMACIILSADGKLLNINVDGVGFFNTSTNNCQPSGINCDTIGMNVTFATNTYVWAYSGDVAFATEIPTNNVPSFPDVASGFSTGWAGESSAARMARILSMAGYTGASWNGGAYEVMGGASVAGADAASALQLVGTTEMGQFYVDSSGTVSLAGRRWRMVQTAPTVIFGESTGSGEVPYQGEDVEISVDPDHIYNQAQVTNQGAPGAASQPSVTYTDPSSPGEYFTSQIQATINANDPNEATYAARYLVGQYAQPLPRIAKVTVDPSANPSVWPQLLQLQFGTRARLMRRPSDSPNAIALDTFVEGVEWKGDTNGRMQVSLQQSPAAPWQDWGVVAPLHSTLQAQAASGQAVITLGALTGGALNPAAAVLAAGTQLVVGFGTGIAETMTVKSVAATSPGYTSVAVTLTANLASTHASGAVVCQPMPSGLPPAVQAGYPASMDAAAQLTSIGPRVGY